LLNKLFVIIFLDRTESRCLGLSVRGVGMVLSVAQSRVLWAPGALGGLGTSGAQRVLWAPGA